MLNHHSQSDSSLLWVPPTPNKAADFNFLLRQLPASLFVGEDPSEKVVVFSGESELLGQYNHPKKFSLGHTIFLVKDNEGVQLEAENISKPVGQYFLSTCRYPDGSFSLEVERNFDHLRLCDSLSRIPERTFRQTDIQPEDLESIYFNPIPPYPRVMAYHPSFGYAVFTFERYGVHPVQMNSYMALTAVRGFRGHPNDWQEFDVGSTRISGRGIHNLSIEAEIGDFFFPGFNSCETPRFTPVTDTRSVSIKDFDPTDLLDTDSDFFDPDAALAMRSLGLPAQWPPAEFL